jgi:hypothetical protein
MTKLDKESQPYLVGFVSEINKSMRDNRKTYSVLDTSPDWLHVVDDDGEELFVNMNNLLSIQVIVC